MGVSSKYDDYDFIVELFGDFDRSPLRDDSPEMVFVVERTE